MRIGLETAVLPVVPPTKKKIPITATEAINLEYSKEWVNAMELELEWNEVAVPTSVTNVPRNKKFQVESD